MTGMNEDIGGEPARAIEYCCSCEHFRARYVVDFIKNGNAGQWCRMWACVPVPCIARQEVVLEKHWASHSKALRLPGFVAKRVALYFARHRAGGRELEAGEERNITRFRA